MTRHTEVTLADGDTIKTSRRLNPEFSNWLDETLDKFWNLIEDEYEDEWRVEYNGTMVLQVDEEMLERILKANPDVAREAFRAYEEHDAENRRYEWRNFPEHLLGLYAITGVYDTYYRMVNGPREYFFEQGY